MTTVPEGTKPRIQKTSRIMLKSRTIYCSSAVLREVRPLLIMLKMKHFPKRDSLPQLLKTLGDLSYSHPDHFPETTRVYLNQFGKPDAKVKR
jgi:hypothetical protein